MIDAMTSPAPQPVARPASVPPHEHIVQFYEVEDALIENVAKFIGDGIEAAEPIIVIATPEHRAAFCDRLRRLGLDVDAAVASGRFALLDARETLAMFMVGDAPSWDRFRDVIGAVLLASRKGAGDRRVRAYGEMVDLLWRDGNRTAALRLEQFWNDIAREHTFTLLCAYVMGNFYKSGDADPFHEVCAAHSHVIPVDTYEDQSFEQRSRILGELQQRARSLESEVQHRKELELALRESLAREKAMREEAERNVRFADMFCGMLGHDLRNPLGTITMGATYVARGGFGEKATKSATRIVNSAERMARMIDQLLDFTRIRAAGGLELHRTRTDLGLICERVKEEIEAGAPNCTISMTTVGNTGGYWDHDRLLQVFSNLVGNAVTHGSTSCEVSVEADGSESAEVVAYVKNAGAIDPEVLPVIFDPFRGGKKRHNTKGLGLGLFITRQIVIAHGGEIAVTTNDTQGTLFCVKLPRFPRAIDDARVRM